jgi:hypothetical protein
VAVPRLQLTSRMYSSSVSTCRSLPSRHCSSQFITRSLMMRSSLAREPCPPHCMVEACVHFGEWEELRRVVEHAKQSQCAEPRHSYARSLSIRGYCVRVRPWCRCRMRRPAGTQPPPHLLGTHLLHHRRRYNLPLAQHHARARCKQLPPRLGAGRAGWQLGDAAAHRCLLCCSTLTLLPLAIPASANHASPHFSSLSSPTPAMAPKRVSSAEASEAAAAAAQRRAWPAPRRRWRRRRAAWR